MKRFAQIGYQIGQLVETKNAAYGSSFAKAGDFLRLLYPDGIGAQQYDDALLLVRIFDKQMRIATDRDALGESPYRDIAGYGILGASLHETKGGKEGLNGGRKPDVSARVSTARLRANRQAKREQVLQQQLPHERFPRAERSQAADVPSLRKKPTQARAATESVSEEEE